LKTGFFFRFSPGVLPGRPEKRGNGKRTSFFGFALLFSVFDFFFEFRSSFSDFSLL